MAEQEPKLTQDQQDSFALMALVEFYQHTAWIALGKVADPSTNETKRNLMQARWAIDTIAMLERKTRGNLSDHESRFLREILHLLRMNYVDEANKPVEQPATAPPAPEEEAAAGPEKDEAAPAPETPANE